MTDTPCDHRGYIIFRKIPNPAKELSPLVCTACGAGFVEDRYTGSPQSGYALLEENKNLKTEIAIKERRVKETREQRDDLLALVRSIFATPHRFLNLHGGVYCYICQQTEDGNTRHSEEKP